MKVTEFMSTRVVTVDADATLDKMKSIFDRTGFHHLLVTDGDDLVGVVSDRELLHHMSPYLGTLSETNRDKAGLHKRAHQIMQRDPAVLTYESTLEDVLKIFSEQRETTCVAVNDPRGTPVGIITWRDLLRLLARFNAERKTEG